MMLCRLKKAETLTIITEEEALLADHNTIIHPHPYKSYNDTVSSQMYVSHPE